MKKLSKLLSKKFNELHLLVQQTESKDTLKIVLDGIENLQEACTKRSDQIKAYVNSAESEILLDRCLNHAFPNYNEIGKTLNDMRPEDQDVKNVYDKKYLPFHTRDNDWLVKYLREVSYRSQTEHNAYKLEMGVQPEDLKEISLVDIENYIINSKRFASLREKYEENVVYQIVNSQAATTKEGSATWFRRLMLNDIKEMGINEKVAAVAMEKDQRWREVIFKNAFHNHVYRNSYSLLLPKQEERAWLKANHFTALVGLEMIERDTYQCFKAYEEYKYYQWEDTKKIIDELHLANNNMRMSNKEAKQVYDVKLQELCDKYIKEARICRKIIKREMNQGLEK